MVLPALLGLTSTSMCWLADYHHPHHLGRDDHRQHHFHPDPHPDYHGRQRGVTSVGWMAESTCATNAHSALHLVQCNCLQIHCTNAPMHTPHYTRESRD